ncbi:hypothetical protein [Bacillus salacetis]|uniref:hypothetical protein n=1 Tax=Bacillus salacetis TaxID=2315464 RepID=UPI0014439051|nr:hypothetical protein [Bacillus salacetis]
MKVIAILRKAVFHYAAIFKKAVFAYIVAFGKERAGLFFPAHRFFSGDLPGYYLKYIE